MLVILNITDPWQLGDLIAVNIEMKLEERQAILASSSIEEKLWLITQLLEQNI
jgi:hypothetical protein